MDELWAFKPYLFTMARNWQLKVDESAGLFHSSGANKINMEQVNFPFIGPHSRALLWCFPLNHFSLQSTPRFSMWTAVYIPQPPFTFICRASFHSGATYDRWSISPLIFNRWIKHHIPHSAGHPGHIHRASFHSGIIHNYQCDLPLFLYH